ncbi:MAG TPA: biotin/lipoyl-containing protein [Streptosporangiaceae bacterium]|nr:biotin/lipoyl-containing protein [Streptosporangiaceae bacterium]
MDLTNEDVADILALLDSLPYDELDLQTPRFRLTLRRTPDGWTQAAETRVAPSVVDVAPADGAAGPEGGAAGPEGGAATGTMAHRPGYNRYRGPSSRLGSKAGGTGGVSGSTEVSSEVTGPEVGGANAGPGVTEVDESLVAVRAPLPGTFYRAPRPGAAPFVEVGSRVGADTVVGIVETMKLFNSVAAGVAGTVAEICLANAEFAARGATLLRIRAD